MAVCLNHPDRDAVTTCASCGRPICAECVVAGKYCSDVCQERGIAAAARSGEVLNEKKRTAKSSAVRRIFILIAVIILAVAACWFYKNNKKAIDSKARELSRDIEKQKKELVSEGHKAVPKNSKYKRDREALVE